MKKSLFLCVFACFVLTRPVLAEWIPCNEGVKEWDLDVSEVISKCGSNYQNGCYYETNNGEIDCTHVASCSCPSGYYGTCTGTNYSTCYKTCNEKCDASLAPTGCPQNVPCADWFGINYNTTCTTGRQYYGQSTCIASGNCHCLYDIPENYGVCPEGYRDCGNTYNKAKDDESVCCKIPTAGTYVKVAKGDAVSCEAGYYCPSGIEIYYGSIGGRANCPTPGTSGTGKSAITDCYIPKGTPFSDETGSGKYTADCYYQ